MYPTFMASSYLATDEMIREKNDYIMLLKIMYVRGADEYILDWLIDIAKSANIATLSEDELVNIFMEKVELNINDSMWGPTGRGALKRTLIDKIKFLRK